MRVFSWPLGVVPSLTSADTKPLISNVRKCSEIIIINRKKKALESSSGAKAESLKIVCSGLHGRARVPSFSPWAGAVTLEPTAWGAAGFSGKLARLRVFPGGSCPLSIGRPEVSLVREVPRAEREVLKVFTQPEAKPGLVLTDPRGRPA